MKADFFHNLLILFYGLITIGSFMVTTYFVVIARNKLNGLSRVFTALFVSLGVMFGSFAFVLVFELPYYWIGCITCPPFIVSLGWFVWYIYQALNGKRALP